MSIIFEKLLPSDKSATGFKIILRESPTSFPEPVEVSYKVGKALLSAQRQAADEVRDAIKKALNI